MTVSQVPLSTVTSFEIGGIASSAHVVDCREDALIDVIAELEGRQATVVAGGSNILASDDGTDRDLLLWSGAGTCESRGAGEVRVDASMELDAFVESCIAVGLQGMEQLSGIPGTIGGAIVQNAGAYDHDIAGTRFRQLGAEVGVTSVQCVNVETGEVSWRDAEQCDFSYRSSWFKRNTDWVIVQCQLRLNEAPTARIANDDVRKHIGSGVHETEFPLETIRRAVLAERHDKGHFLDAEHRSAGSFFKNPIVAAGHPADALKAKLANRCEAFEPWLAEPRRLSRAVAGGQGEQFVASLLIMTSADDETFTPHSEHGAVRLGHGANVLMNNAHATATDVIDVANRMRRSVWSMYDVVLEPEVVFLGDLHLAEIT